MTRIFEQPASGGGVRILIAGVGSYPQARRAVDSVPALPDISSAAESAMSLARLAISSWAERFSKPLVSVDLLVNAPDTPTGSLFNHPRGEQIRVEAPTLTALKAARTDWLAQTTRDDVVIFYCCGHGIWLPSRGRTFLAADFGEDDEDPWTRAIWLDGFALGLAEKPPRTQWLIFDCCANTPTQAMLNLATNPAALLSPQIGGRGRTEATHGTLSQVILASATVGAQAFGRAGRPSRFAEALIDACEISGYQTEYDGYWWIDPGSLDKSIGSFAQRVADPSDEPYYTFPRVITTDAADPPLLMKREQPSMCTVMVMSEPLSRLPRGELVIRCGEEIVAQQSAGLWAHARFRHDLAPWRYYQFQLKVDESPVLVDKFAMPPFVKAIFPKEAT